MAITLWPHQQQGVDDLRAAYVRGARAPLYVLPTGGGKTITFAHIAAETVKRGRNVLLLAHRKELVKQISSAISLFDVDHGLILPGHKSTDHDAMVASVQTLVRRVDKISWDPGLIIIDEAHHSVAGSWRKIIEAWPGVPLLGVTATPQRLDGNGLGIQAGGVFDSLIQGPSVSELTADGFLSPYKLFRPPNDFDRTKLHVQAGEFKRGESEKAVDKPTITGDAIAHYMKYAMGERGLAFCTTVAHAQHTAMAFRSTGIPAEVLAGKMDEDVRDAMVHRLETGETKVLCTCEIVSEGFDLPAVSVAMLLRPTASETMYLQQVGRALRAFKGKLHAFIFDHVGNSNVHGYPDDDRGWSLEGRKKRAGVASDKSPPVKQCLQCYAVFRPAPVCPECGTPVPKVSQEIEQVEGELVEVTEEQKRATRIERRREETTCQTIEQLEKLGQTRGYKPGWAKIKWRGMNNRRARLRPPMEMR